MWPIYHKTTCMSLIFWVQRANWVKSHLLSLSNLDLFLLPNFSGHSLWTRLSQICPVGIVSAIPHVNWVTVNHLENWCSIFKVNLLLASIPLLSFWSTHYSKPLKVPTHLGKLSLHFYPIDSNSKFLLLSNIVCVWGGGKKIRSRSLQCSWHHNFLLIFYLW